MSNILQFTLYRYVYWISHSRRSEITPKLPINIGDESFKYINYVVVFL